MDESSTQVGIGARIEAKQQQRAQWRDRNLREVNELLARRDDLKGLHKMADHLAESVAWTA